MAKGKERFNNQIIGYKDSFGKMYSVVKGSTQHFRKWYFMRLWMSVRRFLAIRMSRYTA